MAGARTDRSGRRVPESAGPRRILMTADTVGGVFTFALELARELSHRGIEIHLATLGRPPAPGQREELRSIRGLTLHASAYRLEWMDEPWIDLERSGAWLLGIERETAPDIVHLGGYAHGALRWRAPVLITAHSCVFSWFQAVKGGDPPAGWARYRSAAARGIAAADCIAAPSGAMLESLHRNYGPLRRACVIPNGLDPARFTRGVKERFFFASGRLWDEAKNLSLVEAASTRLPWPVYAAGTRADPNRSDPARPKPDRADAAGRDGAETGSGRIRFLGPLSREEMAAWLARAPVFVHPARYEPFGLAPLEAALSSAALVLGDIPSLREIWADAALYVPPSDPDRLAGTLIRLASDGRLRAELSEAAYARAARYRADAMAESYLALYRELLEAGRGEAGPDRPEAAGNRTAGGLPVKERP